jgi:hypothetical protein
VRIFTFGTDVGATYTTADAIKDVGFYGPGYAAVQALTTPTDAEEQQDARESIEWVLKLARERPQDVQEAFLVRARRDAVTCKLPEYVGQIDALMPKFVGKKMPEPKLSGAGKAAMFAAAGVMLFGLGKTVKSMI